MGEQTSNIWSMWLINDGCDWLWRAYTVSSLYVGLSSTGNAVHDQFMEDWTTFSQSTCSPCAGHTPLYLGTWLRLKGFFFLEKHQGGSLSFVLYCISWLGRFNCFYLPIVFFFKRFFLQTIGNIGQLLNDSNDADFTLSIRLIYK